MDNAKRDIADKATGKANDTGNYLNEEALESRMYEVAEGCAQEFDRMHGQESPKSANLYFLLDKVVPYLLLCNTRRQGRILADQRDMIQAVLEESRTVRRLTKWVVVLTAAVAVLSVPGVVLAWRLLVKGG